jgi:hypothetical protein
VYQHGITAIPPPNHVNKVWFPLFHYLQSVAPQF